MATFEIEVDGRQFEVQAPSREAALSAIKKQMAKSKPTGEIPEGYVFNPKTNQYTSRELMRQNIDVNRPQAAVVGGMQGLALRGADEAMGLVSPYQRERFRATEDVAREKYPYTTGGSEIAGAIGTGLATGGLAGAAGVPVTTSLGGAALGATEGAIFGGLGADGDIQDRAEGAATYGLLGGATGALAPYAVRGAQSAGRFLGDLVEKPVSAVGRATGIRPTAGQSRADRALAKAIEKSGLDEDAINAALRQAAAEGQPEFAVADALGEPGQRQLSAIARSGGEASKEIRDYLASRQAGQPERIAAMLEDNFDLRGTSAKQIRSVVDAMRKESADIAFGGIRAEGNPVDVRGAVSVIDGMVEPFKDAKIQSRSVKALSKLRSQLINDAGDVELSDFNKVFAIRKGLRDEIDAAYRKGRSTLAKDLSAVKTELDKALSASSDDYAGAMAEYARQSRILDAFDLGQEMARPGSRAIDNADTFRALSPEEQAAARVGYGDKIIAQLESKAGEGTNRARPLTSPKMKGDAATIATDPEALARKVEREMRMFETRDIATQGSRTADNLQDIRALEGVDLNVAGQAVANPLQSAGRLVTVLGDAMTGVSEPSRKQIAAALMSNDTRALTRALTTIEDVNKRRQIASAILRSGVLRLGAE